MQPADIERLAHEACYATQYQIKSKAEQKFYNLCLNITQPQLQQLMKNFSQNVLFVTMQYIQKIIPTIKDLRSILTVINNQTQQWYNTNKNSTLIRQDDNILEYHVQNSVGRTLGKCMKYLFMHKQHQDYISSFINNRPNHRYALYLWKLFIQTVSVVDNQLTFLVYRSLVYNFQEYIIPYIMDALLPYFQSVRQQIQINDLAFMQSHLSVSQNNHNSNEQIKLFNPNQIKFTQLVFDVLKEVICFNYNITYSQYQSQQPIDNCLVCFPDQVTKKVANKQFVSSIFYVAQKLINDDFEKSKLNSSFLTTTLQCIQKIMLTKLFYAPTQIKNQFIKTVLISMSRLLGSDKLQQNVILSIIQSNTKFLINFELHLIIKSFDQEYKLWMTKIRYIIDSIIAKSVIHVDNQLVSQAMELVAKIVQDSMTSSPHLKNDVKIFKIFGMEVVFNLLTKLFNQEQSIIITSKIRSFQDLKRNLSQFLKRIRQLCCLNLYDTLKKIQPLLIAILTGNKINSISNVYFFLNQFCDSCVLAKNVLFQHQQINAGLQLGKILSNCLAWINKYRSCGQTVQIIQVSILIFIQKLLSQVLSYFVYEQNQVRITAQIYKHICESTPGLKSQQFLTFCYHEITVNLKNGDLTRATYTFQVLTTLLLKFKWGIKRQYFKQTSIAKFILQLCKQLSQNFLDGNTIVLRKQLFKIITNISFDDTLDDYRTNITQLIISIQNSLQKNRWKVMYDLTGICQAIDTSAIYRYFLITLQKSKTPITTIFNQLFTHIDQASNGNVNTKIQIIKSILRLQLSMIENKGQRLSGTKNTFYNYKLIGFLMPYWVMLLQLPQLYLQQWDQIIILVYKIFNTLLKNNNTNFFMLQRTIPSYHNFIRLFMMNLMKIAKWVQQYPQIFIQYKGAVQNISIHLMEVVFCNKNQDIVIYFNQTINSFMETSIKSFQALSQGNKTVEDSIEAYLQIIKNLFKYLKNARKLEHKVIQKKNLQILAQGIQIKYNYIWEIFKLGISFGKRMSRILDLICKTINNMDFLATSSMPLISQKLGLSQNSRKELLFIWKQREQGQAQFGTQIQSDGFIADIKEWFKKCNNSTMADPDY